MGLHEMQARRVILEKLLNNIPDARILVESILAYAGDKTLADFDLVYKKWVVEQLASIEVGASNFFGSFDTLVELEAEVDPPEGAYAYVGTGLSFKVYFYDLEAEEWQVIEGEQGPEGEVDLEVTDLRYLRKDIPETVTEPLTVGEVTADTIILTDLTPAENPVLYLGILADGTVVPVSIASVTGDKNLVVEVTTPASVWTVNHNLGKFPAFRVKDSAGNPMYPSWDDPSINQIVLTFEAPVTGQIVFN